MEKKKKKIKDEPLHGSDYYRWYIDLWTVYASDMSIRIKYINQLHNLQKAAKVAYYHVTDIVAALENRYGNNIPQTTSILLSKFKHRYGVWFPKRNRIDDALGVSRLGSTTKRLGEPIIKSRKLITDADYRKLKLSEIINSKSFIHKYMVTTYPVLILVLNF